MQKTEGSLWTSKFTLKELIPHSKGMFARIAESLKYKDFRLYFWGQIVSQIGTWMQQIAMSWLVYSMTGSIVLLGTVVFLSQVPILAVTPFSSVFVDRYDQRKLLILTQGLAMLQAFLLAALALTGVLQIWHILALSFALGLINSLDMPTRQAFYPQLVPASAMSNAIALNSAIINGSRLIGPAIGGYLAHVFGEGGCFLINGVSYLFVLAALLMIRYQPEQTNDKVQKAVLGDLNEGFRYIHQSIPIRYILLLITVFSFCAFNGNTFIPAFVKDSLGGNSALLGLVMGTFGVGAFAAALYLAARKSVLGLGKVVVISVSLSGIGLMLLFSIHSTVWALVLACLLGFGLICAMASLNTLLQTLAETNMRGRVMGYYSMAFVGSSALGSLFWSWISKWISLQWTMIICGLICLAAALLFESLRPVVRLHARPIYIRKGIIPEISASLEPPVNP